MEQMQEKDRERIIAEWKHAIANDVRWAERALLKIYAQQTQSEKSVGQTEENNGVGFSRYDSKFLSSVAEGVQKYGHMTPKQAKIVQKIMPRYAGQLFRLTFPNYVAPKKSQSKPPKVVQEPRVQTQEEEQPVEGRFQQGQYA